MENTIIGFKKQMIKEDLADNTIKDYVGIVYSYKRFFGESIGEFKPSEILAMDIREYKNFLRNIKKEKPGTINKKLVALSRYCDYLISNDILKKDPFENIKKIKAQQVMVSPKVLNKNDFHRLKRAFYKENNIRDIAIFETLYNVGTRASELCAIEYYQDEKEEQKSDFNLSGRKAELVIRSGKGQKHRVVPLNKDARKAIADYLAIRPDTRNFPKRNKLFQGQRGNLTRFAINEILKKYSNRAGFTKNIYPHLLRHQLGRDLVSSGADIVSVAEILGHSDINTARLYSLPTAEEKAQFLENL